MDKQIFNHRFEQTGKTDRETGNGNKNDRNDIGSEFGIFTKNIGGIFSPRKGAVGPGSDLIENNVVYQLGAILTKLSSFC